MKEKLLALLMVSVMVASAFGAIGLSATKVGAATATALTLTPSNYLPAHGQPYTLSGRLTDSTGTGVANKPIKIYYYYPYYDNSVVWHYSNTVYTGGDGTYSTTVSSSRMVVLQAIFPGDNVYSGSHSPEELIHVKNSPTKLTLSSSSTNLLVGQQYTLSGRLTDSAGNGMAGREIGIVYYDFHGGSFVLSNTVRTSADGTYSTTTSSSKTVELMTSFLGDDVYDSSSSQSVVVSVAKAGATTLTLGLSQAGSTLYVIPGQRYEIEGRLTDSVGNGVAHKPISISYHFAGEGWHLSNTVYTDALGYYSTWTSSAKTVYLQAGFPGDGSFSASSSTVATVYVRTVSTTLILLSTNYNPSAGQKYTLSGVLTDSAGKGIANKPIDIYYVFAGGTAWHYSNTVYAGADGKYSTATSSSQTVHLKTVFNGDDDYTYSESAHVKINVA